MSPSPDRSDAVQLFTAGNVLTAEECKAIQRAMNTGTRTPAEVLDEGTEVEADARRASDVDVPDEVVALVEARLDSYRDAIGAFYRRHLRAREGAGFLRYEIGGFYGPHVDRANVASWPDAARRQITIVLFLNSSRDADAAGEFAGGRLRLFPNGIECAPVDIVPRQGMLVAFPATIAHEVTEVRQGRRDAVVDWFR